MLLKKIESYVLVFAAMCCSVSADAGNEMSSAIDSLKSMLNSSRIGQNDTTRLSLLYQLSHEYLNQNVDSSFYYSKLLYDEARDVENKRYEMLACDCLEDCYYYQCEYDKCCDLCFEGLAIAHSLDDKRMMARFNSSLGSAYGMRADALTADGYYNKAYKLYSQLSDTIRMARVLNNMAINALNNDMFDVADEYATTTLNLCRNGNDIGTLAESYFLLGGSYGSRYDLDPVAENMEYLIRSLDYFYVSRQMSQSVNEVFDVAKCDIYIVQDYTELSELQPERETELLDSCRVLLDESYAICVNNGFDSLLDMYKNSRLAWLIKVKRYAEAETYLDSLFSAYSGDVANHGMEMEDTYAWYSELYSMKGQYKKAFESKTQFHRWYRKNRQNDFAAKSATNMAETRFNVEMQVRERENLERELQYKANAKMMFIVIIAVVVILVLVVINFIKSRNANRLLDEKNCELEQQKEEILAINDDLEHQRDLLSTAHSQITDSISYASLIQNAAMPTSRYLDEVFGDHFVFFRPKDIVSGDFYWVHQGANRQLLVVADCTGHGVPGAFVSMLGVSLLNEIVARFGMGSSLQQKSDSNDAMRISAGRFLDDLRTMLRDALHQHSEETGNRDGMDLGLVIVDNDTQTIHYAGAFRPLYIYHEGVFSKIDGDRMPIGGDMSVDAPFTDHELPFSQGDMLYMFSDGIVDQFGYDQQRGKEVKYSARRLRNLLDEINQLPCQEQLVRIKTEVDAWRRVGTPYESEQTDDNIMVGIRL